MPETVLGRLVLQFSGHPENLATEGLAYLLESGVAADAVLRRLATTGVSCPDDLRFTAQVHGQEGEIPDVVGTDAGGVAQVVLEAKFWAQLTPNQPVTYLRGVAGIPPRALAFIVPRMRFETIWPELLRRCAAAGITLSQGNDLGDLRYARTSEGGVLAMVSWARLLDDIRVALESAGEHGLAGDARQLEGLAHQMDTNAPLPFESGFLTSEEPALRYVQLTRLVNEVTDRAVANGIASIKGLRAAASFAWIGRYLMLGPIGVRLGVDFDLWSRYATSPIWLSISDGQWVGDGRIVRGLLQKLPWLASEPSRIDSLHREAVPLFIPAGKEWPAVVDEVYAQLSEVHTCFGHLPPPSDAIPSPPEIAADNPVEAV